MLHRSLVLLVSLLAALPVSLVATASSSDADPGPVAAAGRLAPGCRAGATPFRPAQARFSSVPGRYRVVRVARRHGAIGTPPISQAGKTMVGWDPETRPGSARGTVIIDAHTWPDGSALGNRLLRSWHAGDRVAVSSSSGSACYVVTSRRSYPRDRVPTARLFRSDGQPRLVMIVCSGRRLGPGNWLRRTVWVAQPPTR